MQDFEDILEMFEDYKRDPRPMDQEPVTMDQEPRMGFAQAGIVKKGEYIGQPFVRSTGKNIPTGAIKEGERIIFLGKKAQENADNFYALIQKSNFTKEQLDNLAKWEKANPTVDFDDLTPTMQTQIRKTGNPNIGVVGTGGATPKGADNPQFQPLSKKGEKIAMKVYGTTDISTSKRQAINAGEVTMNTKPVKMNKETDISVKSKKGQPVTSVDFKGLKMPDGTDMETAFMEDLKLRASEPEKAVLTNKYGNKYFADKYPISDRQLKRAIPFLMKQEGLEYPKLDESFAVRATRQRKEKLSPSSSLLEEGRISKAKTKILKEQNLSRKIDTAHRVSKTHMNRLGLQFDTDLMGMDSRVINQVIIKPSEIKLDRLYRKQFDVFEKLKKKPTDVSLRTELNDINKQVKSIVKTTSGRLVGVTINPYTLETSFEGLKKKYSLTQFMKKNMTMKDLEKFDYKSPQQQEFLTKTLNKAVNAEVKKGFVPNDFKQILSDKKSREAILKYAQKKTPELVGKLKQAIKNPTSKVSMKVLSVPIMAGAVYNYGEDFLKGTGIVDREYEQTASAGDAPIVEKEFTTGQKVAGTGVAAGGAYAARKKIMSGLGKVARPFGTPLAGPLFAGYTAYDNLKQGKGIRESVIDPLVGMELTFPSLFTENISKITKNPTAQKILNLGGAQKILGGAGVAITVGDILDNRAKAMKKESDRISTLEIDDQKKAIEDYAAKDYRGYAEGGLAGLMKKYYD